MRMIARTHSKIAAAIAVAWRAENIAIQSFQLNGSKNADNLT